MYIFVIVSIQCHTNQSLVEKQLLLNELQAIKFSEFKMCSVCVTSENDIMGVWITCFYSAQA